MSELEQQLQSSRREVSELEEQLQSSRREVSKLEQQLQQSVHYNDFFCCRWSLAARPVNLYIIQYDFLCDNIMFVQERSRRNQVSGFGQQLQQLVNEL